MTDLPEETGDERADTALGGLARLGTLPVSAHVGVFEEVLTGLEQALASVDDTPDRPR
jgi:hypothetical protein